MVRTGAQAVSGQVSFRPSVVRCLGVIADGIYKACGLRQALSQFSYPPRSYPPRIHSHYHPLPSTLTHPCIPSSLYPHHRATQFYFINHQHTQHHGRREQPEPKRASQEVSKPISKYALLLGSSNLYITQASTDQTTCTHRTRPILTSLLHQTTTLPSLTRTSSPHLYQEGSARHLTTIRKGTREVDNECLCRR